MGNIKLTGMSSGLDTESIITELVKAKSTKLDTLKGEQKKLQWKQDAWKELNSKVYSFYSSTLSDMRYKSSYAKKTTKSSSSAVSVVTGSSAPNVEQTLKIKQMAKAGYITGGKLSSDGSVTTSTKLCDSKSDGGLGVTSGSKITLTKTSGESYDIEINDSTTLNDVVKELKNAGVNANFDAKQQRLYISSSAAGEANGFEITGDDATLSALGLKAAADGADVTDKDAVIIKAQDAKITLNGAEYSSTTNSFEINGLTLTVNNMTDDEISLSTTEDYDGIYDMIKNFFTEYNKLINEMDSLYNADSAEDYDMLTDDEKDEMSDSEIEDWENKIKDALLRRDSTLNTVADAMKTIMLSGVTMSDGSVKYLSDFGINTLGYFTAADNEKNAYHIDGDSDDSSTSSNEDKLRAAIATDPTSVSDFFSGLARNLYDKINGLMKATTYSSSFTLYNDKEMTSQYSDYDDKISDQEDAIEDFEDRWYSKFSAMETALSKLESKSSAVSSLLG